MTAFAFFVSPAVFSEARATAELARARVGRRTTRAILSSWYTVNYEVAGIHIFDGCESSALMPSRNSWVLLDVLDPRQPTVVAVGTQTKNRVALSSFIRASDRDAVMAAVLRASRHGTSTRIEFGSRVATVDPITDDASGLVHGAWLHVGRDSPALVDRPSAWAFEWDLDTGVARRSAIASSTQSWSELGIDETRPISDGLARLDLGSSTSSVLAHLVSNHHGQVVQHGAVEKRPSGEHRRIQFTAHFVVTEADQAAAPRTRLVRGLSVDLGPWNDIDCERTEAANLGELIARSLATPQEYQAIADPDSLRLLYWYGPAPESIAWKNVNTPGAQPVLHCGDRSHAFEVAQNLKVAPAGSIHRFALRFLTTDDTYVSVPVTARAMNLDDTSRAILLTLRPDDER